MSYSPYYPSGWLNGESGATPITPDALNHMEDGIKNALPTVLTEGEHYGDTLPAPGTPGRIFFKKVT